MACLQILLKAALSMQVIAIRVNPIYCKPYKQQHQNDYPHGNLNRQLL